MVVNNGLIDLGHVPKRIRSLAYFWGGTNTGAKALYELAQMDGLVGNVDELRSNIFRVHDLKIRDELLTWLGNHVQ